MSVSDKGSLEIKFLENLLVGDPVHSATQPLYIVGHKTLELEEQFNHFVPSSKFNRILLKEKSSPDCNLTSYNQSVFLYMYVSNEYLFNS